MGILTGGCGHPGSQEQRSGCWGEGEGKVSGCHLVDKVWRRGPSVKRGKRGPAWPQAGAVKGSGSPARLPSASERDSQALRVTAFLQ